jgi:hypothetical protein
MQKTGESYTSARAMLLTATATPSMNGAVPALATTDEKIRSRTGRGWEEWFDLLDKWGAGNRSHREIARWIAEQLEISPLAWNAQAIADTYERVRGMKVVGQHPDGFRVSVSKTVGVPVGQLYAAFVDPKLREVWLPGADLRDRTATAPRTARFDWGDGPGRLHINFAAKSDTKSTITVSHIRLVDAAHADEMKAFWRSNLDALAARLEDGGLHA